MLWWIEDPVLRAGDNPGTDLVKSLRKNERLATVISLLDEIVNPPAYSPAELTDLGITRYNIPVPDFTPPNLDQLRQFVRLVEQAAPEGQILVHCSDGLTVTATFAAAWLMHQGFSLPAALNRIREDFPLAVEDDEHKRILERYDSLR
ncbi:dual specificity protein phosphatase family protein [Candidatus Fermentibacterales bacterium]|nr:dual specificity protein phosphatase family protein [Candidatus Fermentibacterales bacterium]